MKRLIVFVIICAAILSLTVCSGRGTSAASSASSEDINWPTAPLTLISGGSAGGPADFVARVVAAGVEKELGQSVIVVNKPGANSWVAVETALKGKRDGYEFVNMAIPALTSVLLNPKQPRSETVDDLIWLGAPGFDPNVFFIKAGDTRFSDLDSFLKYAREYEVTATTTGAISDDDIAIKMVNKIAGTKIVATHFKGSNEGFAAVLGGHIDMGVMNVGEVVNPANEGTITPLFVLDDHRCSFLPDTPTLNETGLIKEPVIANTTRGFIYPGGVDAKIVAKMTATFEKVLNNPDVIKQLRDYGFPVEKSFTGDEWRQVAVDAENNLKALSKDLGW
jgi:tripartite-type tricarboxylate transporter receptor subunit TctC